MGARVDTEQKMAEFLAFLREQKWPFLTVCAEAVGLSRGTMRDWLAKGQAGDPRYEAFTTEVYKIRARAALAIAAELDSEATDRHAGNRKQHMLGKLMREDFDPPKEIYEKVRRDATDHTPPALSDGVDDATRMLTATCTDITGKT